MQRAGQKTKFETRPTPGLPYNGKEDFFFLKQKASFDTLQMHFFLFWPGLDIPSCKGNCVGVVFRKFEKERTFAHTLRAIPVWFSSIRYKLICGKNPKRLVPFSHDKPTRNSHKRVAARRKNKILGLKFIRHLFFFFLRYILQGLQFGRLNSVPINSTLREVKKTSLC